ncbi:hypothetical protein [Actinotalea sp. K2]|uniref:hypothetical protein n=1 Tax=Actinotalea sp. K2 TaxID=2939438 RepID=UPI002016F49C|nr:hypothetical protein [Actinotalea sp. K2]MCL3861157.1 hypothetical protein [Actinotalea sp. K2]
MSIDRERVSPPGGARITLLSLEALTAVGAVTGVQGFLTGAFDPLVDQVHDAWPIVQVRILPAAALGAVVALPQAVAFVLGLRHHRWAADAGVAAGAALTAWVTLQLPLIGWTSPVQWAFVGVGVVQVVAATVWRRHVRRPEGTDQGVVQRSATRA